MGAEIIYEKKYPRFNAEEALREANEAFPETPSETKPTYEEIIEKIYGNLTYELMPERKAKSEKLVSAAIKVSELYDLDITVKRYIDHISITYSFDCCGGLKYINKVIGMADQTSYFTNVHGKDITIVLDYYTHTVYREGRAIAP